MPVAQTIDAPRLVTVRVRRLPEGVYLGTSDDLPGLIVEADSREEIIDEAQQVARDLLDESGRVEALDHLQLAFIFE